MSKGKNLTYKMKRFIDKELHLIPEEWTYVKNTSDLFVLVNKNTNEKKYIDKTMYASDF